jgi:hypothetical protein
VLEEPTVPASIVAGLIPLRATTADAISCASDTSISLAAARTVSHVAAASSADRPDP